MTNMTTRVTNAVKNPQLSADSCRSDGLFEPANASMTIEPATMIAMGKENALLTIAMNASPSRDDAFGNGHSW